MIRKAAPVLGALTAVLTVFAPAAHAADMRSRQWYLDAMKAEEIWQVSTGSGVTVAVIDTGVDADVPELRGRVLEGANFEEAGDGRVDKDGHGTNMAVTIAGNGAQGGIKGLAPGAKILPVTSSSDALGFGGHDGLAKGIRYVADTDARIINVSRGGKPTSEDMAELRSAVDYALQKGKLIFAASGNEGDEGNPIEYPAALPGVVAVGALDTKGKVTKFSGYRDYVALSAPGDKIPAHCTKSEGYCETSGTSYATALASASAALIWSAHPDWTANQVLRVMMETAGHDGPVPSKYIGYGTIRPRQVLLEGKGDPGPADVNPLLAARTPSTTPSASPSPEHTGASGNEPAETAAARADKDVGVPLWAIAAVAVAVVAIGATAAVKVRSRRA
ncbi:type VII secretion-associated serine protease mycosin [Streptomyces sannanensis]|uniref:Type VII secretion-associated serine protease mycosin n=1 Tax=Streptomyces sannanensis TaxID=285536 RepID=A0ABP6SGS9_9ACTN